MMCRWRGGREGQGCRQLSGWLSLALPTHQPGAAGLRGSLGVAPQSCTGKYLGSWGRQSPEPGTGPGSDPGPALSSFQSTGPNVTLTATPGLSGPRSWPRCGHSCSNRFKFHCHLPGPLATSFLPRICPLHGHANSHCSENMPRTPLPQGLCTGCLLFLEHLLSGLASSPL